MQKVDSFAFQYFKNMQKFENITNTEKPGLFEDYVL
jgi:hypothetical protein